MKLWLLQHGLNSNILMPLKYEAIWMWKYQEDWCCMCKHGRTQSPISIIQHRTIRQHDTVLLWRFIEAHDAFSKYNGNENEIFGTFGEFEQQIGGFGSSSKKFKIFKIGFKFPSEHEINGMEYPGEMLIYGKTSGGIEGIISIMIEPTSETIPPNKFLSDLQLNSYNFDADMINKIEVEDGPSLEDIVEKGATLAFKKSFYSYIGSETTPPCKQNVIRFVMQNFMTIPLYQFMQLKNAIYNEEREPQGNSRKRFPMFNVPVYYHADLSANCLDQELPDTHFHPEYEKFARATQNITLYGLTSEDIPVQGYFPEHNVSIEVVNGSFVPDYIRERIIQRYMKSKETPIYGLNRTRVDIISGK